ncbi:MAG: LysR family transcriptional regulator [Desulfobacterales bacterium]|nr:LysR family transcriptional regulator [Desulfobacterales bacterium]MBF0398281.1 LysR family transcriptional regulator [Desulfobacterales bacterium]
MSYDNFKNISIQQLESFFYLMGERSFSRAAKKMFVTQPSLTKQIKNLEAAVGEKLVNREDRSVTLTEQGKIVYDYAKKVLSLREEVKEKIIRIKKNDTGSIEISASTIPANYILPRVLSEFRISYPNIQFYLRQSNSEEVIDMIISGRSEIGFIGKNISNSKLYTKSVWKDKLVLIVPKKHPFIKREFITIGELLKEPYIAREKGSASREVFESYLKENKGITCRLNTICELGSSEAIKEAVIAGLGVSIISRNAVYRELFQGIINEIPINDLNLERNIYLIYRRQLDLMKHHKVFIEFIEGVSKIEAPSIIIN